MKPTHKELVARAMLLGGNWFYDWRDGTFTASDNLNMELLDPETLEKVDHGVAANRRLGRAPGWERSIDMATDRPLWETPIARMDEEVEE